MGIKVTALDSVSEALHSSDLYYVAKFRNVFSGSLIVGATYTIASYAVGDNFSNVANVQSGTINTSGCVFIATGTTPTNWTNSSSLTFYEHQKVTWNQIQTYASPYKKYKIHFIQSGTSNPAVTVFENTLSGTPTWTRTGVGLYDMTLTGEFLINKLYISGFINTTGLAPLAFIPISNSVYYYYIQRIDNDTIRLGIVDSAGTPVEWSTVFAGGNDYFSFPEIQVYL